MNFTKIRGQWEQAKTRISRTRRLVCIYSLKHRISLTISSWKMSIRLYSWNRCKHTWKSGRPAKDRTIPFSWCVSIQCCHKERKASDSCPDRPRSWGRRNDGPRLRILFLLSFSTYGRNKWFWRTKMTFVHVFEKSLFFAKTRVQNLRNGKLVLTKMTADFSETIVCICHYQNIGLCWKIYCLLRDSGRHRVEGCKLSSLRKE